MPNNWLAITLSQAKVPRKPKPTPAGIELAVYLRTERRMSRRCLSRAIRSPILRL
jgi:hypothetical protein